MENTEIIQKLLSLCETDRKVLQSLKHISVTHQQYEIACALRDMERKVYPISQEDKDAYDYGVALVQAFDLSGLKISPKAAYMASRIIKEYDTKKDDYDLKTASKIKVDAERIFWE